ncbi:MULTISPECIES: phage antirepressor KilAC domain-containing protein [unclassified Faecalibacillus]|uniref:phage antirepressor KilAC domain-containing protein n=1 Tax=unclassified Faecalibacillus TaxID=2678890 RepID=UPI001D0BD4AE|nr:MULTISPECIES: phage antirepressor KilAC domain-containing protein [unclassified Faecalibacillus]MCB8540858.1 phage antirepressor KilAC domain-containing protein [Faecalibacillus sp. TM498]MCB8558491.1 phage antirepressor KilAC domain-containing protein [Faecalibacillus sp. TM111]
MNELLKVNYASDRITLSARELHEFLEIETPFKKWFGRMAEYGFSQEIDYREVMDKIVQNPKGGRPSTDYEITLDMAKEIAMIQRSDKGKEVRQYFLELERRWNSPEAVMNRALEYSRKQVKALMEENKELKPKALFADAVSASDESILIGQLAKLIRQNGYEIGQNRLFEWMRESGYLIKSGSRRNQPTQRAMDMGLFEVKERTISNPDGSTRITLTTKVTGKGQVYFVNKFLS